MFGTDFEKSLDNPKHKHEYMINLFRDLPLLCEPGEAWNYSNFGYYLLGCIIENVSGVSYDEFFKKNIFKPLNMNDTGVERDKKIIQGLATGYYLNDDEYIIPMFPISENQFHHTWIDESYRFSKDENGDLWFCGMKKQE